MAEVDPDSWWGSWEINIRGTFRLIRHAAPHLVQSAQKRFANDRTRGHLILISSVGAQLLTVGASDYRLRIGAIKARKAGPGSDARMVPVRPTLCATRR
jgi:NAD(P)-dependent dehydrogenase (short-subunit alcohol dehydrogenase family)